MRILLIGKDPEFVVQEPAVMHMPLEVGLNATESEPVANVCPKDSDDHMSKELTKDILRVEFPKDPDLVEVESEKVGLLKNLCTKKLYSIVIILLKNKERCKKYTYLTQTLTLSSIPPDFGIITENYFLFLFINCFSRYFILLSCGLCTDRAISLRMLVKCLNVVFLENIVVFIPLYLGTKLTEGQVLLLLYSL